MDLQIDSEKVVAGAEVVGGFGALAGGFMAFIRRQRSNAARWAKLEAKVDEHEKDITDLKGEMIKRLDRIENILLGAKP